MIGIIIQSYYTLFLSIGLAALVVFIIGLFMIFRRHPTPVKRVVPVATTTPPLLKREDFNLDFTAISGDDVMATQLDLARAYIETGKKQLAQSILQQVTEQGSAVQKQEAEQLLRVIFI
jgi:FimV-like protein